MTPAAASESLRPAGRGQDMISALPLLRIGQGFFCNVFSEKTVNIRLIFRKAVV